MCEPDLFVHTPSLCHCKVICLARDLSGLVKDIAESDDNLETSYSESYTLPLAFLS